MLSHEQVSALLEADVPDPAQRLAVTDLFMGMMGRELLLQAYDLGSVPGITPRQRQILESLHSGKDAQETADALGISIHTVRTVTRRLREHHNVPTTNALIRHLRLQGVIKSGDIQTEKTR